VYWKEVRAEARTKTRAEFRSRTRITIALSILGFALSCIALAVMGVPIPITLFVGLAAAIGANLIYSFWQWCSHMIAIPSERDLARLKTIEERDKEIARLRVPSPELIRIKFKDVKFEKGDSASVVNIDLEVHNGGPAATTLSGWTLQSKLYGDVATVGGTNLGQPPYPDLVELEQGKVRYGSINFRIKAGKDQVELIENEWWLEFSDVAGRVYKKTLPPDSNRQ
jgi:hypothetical protein